MSTTSSIETPTSPTAPNMHHQPQHYHQHTTATIVVSAGSKQQQHQLQAQHQPQQQQQHYCARNSFSAPCTHSTPSLLTPSSSTSSSQSVSGAAVVTASATQSATSSSVSAAVHHPQHQQQLQHNMPAAARPSVSVMPNTSIKRHHADVCCSSSSSSCCSSSGSVSAVATSVAAHSVHNTGAVITQKLSRTIPSDKINLRLILVSGKTKEFLFNPSDSAGDIAQTVFDNWPEDWEREAVSKAEILRLIYQGRFLHCNVTLGALGLPLGKTTVMHLVPRDNLPEPNSQDPRQKSKGGSSRCCSTTCCIL